MSVPQMTDSVSDLNGNKAILKDLLKVKLSFIVLLIWYLFWIQVS